LWNAEGGVPYNKIFGGFMKKSAKIKYIVVGMIIMLILNSIMIPVFAAKTTRQLEATFNNIKIVVDNKEIKPTDANGNAVEAFIVNGTTYLPVRAVANALGKEVYWDGPTYTVYLGNMNGKLQYPSLRIEEAVNIGGYWSYFDTSKKTDNYDNTYSTAFCSKYEPFETLLNMKYSRFKGTAYIPKGTANNEKWNFRIEADGKIIYSSPEMTKTSPPIYLNLDITGCNNFKIISDGWEYINFGDCGFYQ